LDDPKGLWKGNNGKIESFQKDRKPLGWRSPDAMNTEKLNSEIRKLKG